MTKIYREEIVLSCQCLDVVAVNSNGIITLLFCLSEVLSVVKTIRCCHVLGKQNMSRAKYDLHVLQLLRNSLKICILTTSVA